MRTPSERIKSLLQIFDSFCVTVIRNFSGNLKRAAENRRKHDGTGEEPVEYLIELLSYTYCSNMAKSGMYPKMLQYLMGHSDIGVTLNTYTHLGLEDAADELKRIANIRFILRKGHSGTLLRQGVFWRAGKQIV